MKMFNLKRKKVLIIIMLITMIAAANIFISNNSIPMSLSEITLCNLTTISYASAEDPPEWQTFTPDPNASGWQNFWSAFGNFFDNVWDQIVSFFSNFRAEIMYDGNGNPTGVRFINEW
jgi:hypothetical protein